jgi:hypothetical protein
VSYTVTVGAGGAGIVTSLVAGEPGNPGNASQFSGTGLTTIVAPGGKGGKSVRYSDVAGVVTSVTNDDNDLPTGGDFNMLGGKGGSITQLDVSHSIPVEVATGGGAVRLFPGTSDDQIRGGNFLVEASGLTFSSYVDVSTGGGGVNNHGQDLRLVSNVSGTNIAVQSLGGGSLKAHEELVYDAEVTPVSGNFDCSLGEFGLVNGGGISDVFSMFSPLGGCIPFGDAVNAPGFGAGSNGVITGQTMLSGTFGGGGGSVLSVGAIDGGLGGGGGGFSGVTSAAPLSGAGGGGVVILIPLVKGAQW